MNQFVVVVVILLRRGRARRRDCLVVPGTNMALSSVSRYIRSAVRVQSRSGSRGGLA